MYSVRTKRDLANDRRRSTPSLGLLIGALVSAPAALAAQQAEVPIDYDAAIAQSGISGSYGYFRAIDGSATLIQSDTGERVQVEVNEPILVGDRIFISGGSRAELVLADRNLIRIGDEAELAFRALANSGDSNDQSSVLELIRGTLQLVVTGDQLGSGYPSVVTPNATVLSRAAGSLLIVVDGDRRTEIVVRQGRAEVHTESEAAEVREGESLFVEGSRGDNLEFASAPSYDRLELWGDELLDYETGQYAEYVDSDLQYGASSLRNNGSWVTVGGGSAWRPYVETGWAPYRNGRWRYTPTGLFWVSYESWGWVPYHYGYWDHHNDWGWLWHPGRRFAGAHVYWYWGPSYAGWVPSGYYWRHYGNHYGSNFGFYYGVYGNIGGGFGRYNHWTFLPHGRLGHRRQHFYSVGGSDLGRRRSALERGVLLTDTRSLRPDTWRRPNDALANLRRAGSRDGRALGDANSFIDRGARLGSELERVTLRGRDGRSGDARSAGGSVRARGDANAQRPNTTIRNRDAATRQLDRTGVQRATGRDARQTDPGAGRSGSGALRRPTSRPAPTGVQRPATRPRVEGRNTETRPAARPPVTRDGSRPTLRRPVTRSAPSRPSARPTPSGSSRPTVRRSGGTTPTRPSARPAPSGSSRPTVRRSGGTPTRPSARPAPTGSSRPTVRRSGGTTSRPAARPAPSRPTRPTVRRSGGTTSRPAARPTPSRSTRPTVRRSGGTTSRPAARPAPSRTPSRPAARPSGGSRSRPAARPSGGGSRSAPRASSGSRSSGGSARSSGGSSRGGSVRSSGGSSRGGSVRSRSRSGG